MSKKVHYPDEIKWKVVEMKKSGIKNRVIMEELGIKNMTQIKTWMRWFRAGEEHRFSQPLGKQYSYGKGPEFKTELEKLRVTNKQLEIQLEILKKYKEIERRWSQKS